MMNLRVDELDEYSGDGDDGNDYTWYVDEEKEDEVIDETESEDEAEAEDDEDDDDEEEKYNISESEDWSCNGDTNNKMLKAHLFKNNLYESEDLSQGIPLRASTAPARPLTELEDFRRSSDFLLLENAVMLSSKLMKRSDNKYDLDSSEGQRICKRFLNQIERLWENFTVKTSSREYRSEFSQAYRVLFVDASLSYLTEILDSAQEGFPFLYVNGEKYMFSQDVLEAGQKLFHGFCEIQHVIKNIYSLACEENPHASVEEIKADIRANLEAFDKYWVTFEQLYVFELMLIEADARRYITKAVEIEKEIANLEMKEKSKGRIFLDSKEYNNSRKELVKVIGQINSVANPEGTGRDDLSIEILIKSESLIRRVSNTQSKSVRVLADKIKKSFKDLRSLFKKYQQNIEVVDPQLRNNPDLVEALYAFENSWEKGAAYFTDPKKWNQLLQFSQVLEAIKEKYPGFANQIDDRDAEIFISIPWILVLMGIDNEDKGLCHHFSPDLLKEGTECYKMLSELKELLGGERISENHDLYNIVEKSILDIEVTSESEVARMKQEKPKLDLILQKVKWVAMQLSRHDPSEWNLFIDVSLYS
jgi:hypothetical protein